MPLIKLQRGVGMIEVLAALFVLSVGLLGVAGLQAQGLIAGHSATQRSVAVMKAYEIIERMRGNPNGVRNVNNATFYAAGLGPVGTPSPYCADLSGSAGADCTAQQLANFDVAVWKDSIQTAFPNMNGLGAIAVNFVGVGPNSPSNVVVTVQWTERGVTQSYVTNTQIVNVVPGT